MLAAARDLAVEEGFSGFTVEKVAERAGVSRMTVYYQFGAKQDLLEALFDDFALRGRIERLPRAFKRADPLDALAEFVSVFCGLWASDRMGLRRIRGWGQLEPESESTGRGRDAWRRQGLEVIVARIQETYGVPAQSALADTIDMLHTLTSFESFDNLATGERGETEVAALIAQTARLILGVDTPHRK